MATTMEIETSNHSDQRYYCHQCERTISPTIPEFLCPTCNKGFIEEINGEDEMDIDEPLGLQEEIRFPADIFRRYTEPSPGRPNRRRRIHIRTGRPGASAAPQNETFGHFAAIDQILQLFGFEGQFALPGGGEGGPGNPGLNVFQVHGNLGDYAWGGRGLDAIITRLLEQMEGSGPPPAEPDKIAALPIVKIAQSDVDSSLECPVCKELFVVNEDVKVLPCKHPFHELCIKPWLEKHDSCPICRLSLNGTRSDTNC